MNPYLLAFSIYALLITPVTLHCSVRVGKAVRYRLRIQAAGLPFIRKTKEPPPQEERTVHEEDVARTLSEPWIWPAIRAVGLRRLKRLLRAIHLKAPTFTCVSPLTMRLPRRCAMRLCKRYCARWPVQGFCPGCWMDVWRWTFRPKVRKFSQAA